MFQRYFRRPTLLSCLLAAALLAACIQQGTPAAAPPATVDVQASGQPAATALPAPLEPTATLAAAPAGEPAPAAAPSSSPAATAAAATPAAPETATPTPASQASAGTGAASPTALISADLANVRGGPGTDYPIVGQAVQGERFAILGRNAAGDWYRIDLDGQDGWVYGPLLTVEGDAAQIAVQRLAPTPAAQRVQVYETTISIPTYPYADFSVEAYNAEFDWTYRRFDRAAYEASNPQPAAKTYKLVVLENEYVRISLLPELGGRIYQVIFKPTGNNELYQNPVLKPSPWGPPEQGGWLAAGGIEWGLPVEEHGYAWGDKWGHIILPYEPTRAGVTVFMPDEGHLRAEVDITLRAGEAAFTLQPRLVNPSDRPVAYKFWLSAMLAPGPANTVGPQLRFLLPTDQVTVHSRGDDSLPGEQQAMAWPVYKGEDYSLLGNWNRWLGAFERPAAHGPHAGVYDQAADEGLLRVFPPAATQGSKVFGLGWGNPIDPSDYTDDGSAYVELHGGLAPTFWDQATLAAGASVSWQETWFPVAGIGGVSHADGNGAVYLAPAPDGLHVGVFPVRPVAGRLRVTVGEQAVLEEDVTLSPAATFNDVIPLTSLPNRGRVAVTLLDANAAPLLSYSQEMTLR